MNDEQETNHAFARSLSNDGLYIVKLEDGVWLAPWDGDPGRTLARTCAEKFNTLDAAASALLTARKSRNFAHAEIEMYNVKYTSLKNAHL